MRWVLNQIEELMNLASVLKLIRSFMTFSAARSRPIIVRRTHAKLV